MKAALFFSILFISGLTIESARAQESSLAPDQNPRYKESQQQYMKKADSLTRTQSTTPQQTYKAYDWYQARMERRQQRREWRHQENLYNGYYNNYTWPSYYSPYSSWRRNFFWPSSVGLTWGRTRWGWW